MTNKKKSNCGRPAGRIKTAKIEISIEPAVKDEFMTLLRNEGKTASVEIGLWIDRETHCGLETQAFAQPGVAKETREVGTGGAF